ncbi:MAG: ATP-grasp domain-containing protein [Longimicrobiales bacterium]
MTSSLILLASCSELPDGDPDTVLLADHLRVAGLQVEVQPWDAPGVDWSKAPITLIRSTWDYHQRHGEFLDWARSIPTLHNPVALIEWNSDKRYLLDLAEDIPVVPSHVLEDPTPGDVTRIRGEFGWSDVVLKPTVGLDGHGVSKLQAGGAAMTPRSGTWILQPLVPEAATDGEISVVLIEGCVSHAVVRRPPAHDFRAQERLGGTVETIVPPSDVVQLAQAAVEWLPVVPLYARVDVVTCQGQPHLMELELVEPSLFFSHSDSALDMITEALGRLGARG